MKKGMLFLLLLSSVLVNAQSLKEALYGGKLKNEPGTVIKKGDDLSTKIDTTHKVSIKDSALTKGPILVMDSSKKGVTQQTESAISLSEKKDTTNAIPEATGVAKDNAAAPKDNNAVLKDYINQITTTLQTEVLPSKKIKNGTYYISLSYSIGTDGQLSFNNAIVTPENATLQQSIKDRLAIDPPKLSPVLSSNGAPRKVNKNYNFSLTKG